MLTRLRPIWVHQCPILQGLHCRSVTCPTISGTWSKSGSPIYVFIFVTKNKMSFFRNLISNSKILQNTNFWKIWLTWPIFLKLLSSTTWMKDTRDSWFTLTLVSSVSLSIHTSGSPYTITTLLVSTVARERMKCPHTFSPSPIMLILTCWEIDTINLCWLLVSKMIIFVKNIHFWS